MLNNTTVAAIVSVLPLSARISSGKGFKPEVQPAVFPFHLDLTVVVNDSGQITYNDRRLLVRTYTAIINITVAAVVSVLPLPPRNSSRIVSLVEVKEENRRLREQISCNHCHIRPKEVVYIPCGHFLYCSICDRLLYHTNCPLCNARIRGWVFV